MDSEILIGGAFPGRKSTDFAGGVLPYKEILPDADWDKPEYLPTGEKQTGNNGDKLNCVTQSDHNSLEMQLNQQIFSRTMPIGHANFLSSKGYIDAFGKVNFSEKFNAILNETWLLKGNYLWKVAEQGRKEGLIPQIMLPENIDDTWDNYYNLAQITREMKAMGLEFKRWFEISYEWINDHSPENLVKELKHAPIQIVIPNHAIVEIKNETDLIKYYDSYNPWVKSAAASKVTDFLKLIIEPITSMTKVTLVHILGTPTYGFLEESDFTKIIHPAVSEAHLLAMATAWGQKITLPDGKINWAFAKDIVV